jgi:hypothetical protein
MEAAELKLKLFRQIDSLEKGKLQELYGLFNNFINSKKDISDWQDLTEEQQEGIFDAISELDEGKGTTNEKVIGKYRKKYSHA